MLGYRGWEVRWCVQNAKWKFKALLRDAQVWQQPPKGAGEVYILPVPSREERGEVWGLGVAVWCKVGGGSLVRCVNWLMLQVLCQPAWEQAFRPGQAAIAPDHLL